MLSIFFFSFFIICVADLLLVYVCAFFNESIFCFFVFVAYLISVCLCTPPQATMLKKMKGKMKRRNTEPTMLVSPGAQLAPLPSNDGESPTDPNNTTFWVSCICTCVFNLCQWKLHILGMGYSLVFLIV